METKSEPTPVPQEKYPEPATQADTKAANAKAKPATTKAQAKKKVAAKTLEEKQEPRVNGGPLTMQGLAESYLAKLESDGKSAGTSFSYRMEMRLALAALGEKTKVARLTRPKVQAFLESDAVTKTRTGLPKSPLSIAKTTRVLKQALTYAVELGAIEKAPMPE